MISNAYRGLASAGREQPPTRCQEHSAMPDTTSGATRLSGLGAIADRFDAAILDQWGVLHDGAKAPPGAIEAVAALVAAGKRLVVLSNSARFGSDSRDKLIALGYPPESFQGVVTSGENTHDLLR